MLRKRYSIHEIFKPHLNILNLTHKPIRPYSYFLKKRIFYGAECRAKGRNGKNTASEDIKGRLCYFVDL